MTEKQIRQRKKFIEILQRELKDLYILEKKTKQKIEDIKKTIVIFKKEIDGLPGNR